MSGNGKTRGWIVGAAIVGATLLQGCAVVTGPYAAERSPVASHSMVTRFDKRFLRADGSRPTGGSPIYMPRERERGPFYFQF